MSGAMNGYCQKYKLPEIQKSYCNFHCRALLTFQSAN
jgi:hypothetical protein